MVMYFIDGLGVVNADRPIFKAVVFYKADFFFKLLIFIGVHLADVINNREFTTEPISVEYVQIEFIFSE